MKHLASLLFLSLIASAGYAQPKQKPKQQPKGNAAQPSPALPQPFHTKSAKNFCEVVGWKAGEVPTAPAGFRVELFADDLRNPRCAYVTPNGDLLVSESNTIKNTLMQAGAIVMGANEAENMKTSRNRVTLLRDADGDGKYETRHTFIENLNQPFGVLALGEYIYIANTDALMRYPYKPGMTSVDEKLGQKITALPAEGKNQHWTRNLIANADGSKIYIAVGSVDNIGKDGEEVNPRRACILEINPDGTGERVYGSGLRNPVGLGWAPGSQTLFTTVNERDELGDDLVPDYLTGVQVGGFYGWPWGYWGQHADPRMKNPRPDLVSKAIVPDVNLGPHTASLGMAFYTGAKFPKNYQGGAFIAQHGSWNRSVLSGYKVVYVPFANGRPSGPPQDFLTGFNTNHDEEVKGRPSSVTMMPDGSLLVMDDVNDRIWRVVAE